MTLVRQVSVCDDEELAALRSPRTDIVAEAADGADAYGLEDGPFRTYRREVDVTLRSDGRHNVVQTTSYELAVPVWGWLLAWPVKRAIRSRQAAFGYWWAPPDRLSAHAATVLGLLCAIQIVDGYLGTVLTQTLSFATDEFDRGNTAQGLVFSLVRFGVLVTLITSAMADRRGRRPLLLFTGVSSCVLTVLGGFSPNLVVLGGSQLFARGLSTALGIIIAIVAVEEMPTRTRAWAASVLTMSAGLGSGMAVWILPVADLDVRGWRMIYFAAIFGVAVIAWAGRRLPETQRFSEHADDDAEALGDDDRSRQRVRFALLGTSLFLLALFAAPASGFHNEFLRDERGFSGGAISLFTVVTATPVGIGVLVGGYLAESWGRRPVAAIGLVAGTVGTVVSFLVAGPTMWIAKLLGNIVGAIAVPALAVYGPELFGTRNRSRANALVVTVGVLGSALGLVLVGLLADRWGNIGGPLMVMALGPAIVSILVLTSFPETAGLDLEDLNPEDRTVDDS